MTWWKWAALAVGAWLLYRHFKSAAQPSGTGAGSGAIPSGQSFAQSSVGGTGYSTSTTSRTPILAFPVVRGGPLPFWGAITPPNTTEARSGRGHF